MLAADQSGPTCAHLLSRPSRTVPRPRERARHSSTCSQVAVELRRRIPLRSRPAARSKKGRTASNQQQAQGCFAAGGRSSRSPGLALVAASTGAPSLCVIPGRWRAIWAQRGREDDWKLWWCVSAHSNCCAYPASILRAPRLRSPGGVPEQRNLRYAAITDPLGGCWALCVKTFGMLRVRRTTGLKELLGPCHWL